MAPETNLTYKAIFEMVSLPIIVADSDKSLIFSNNEGLKITGLSPASIYNKKIDEIMDFDEEELQKIEDTLLKREPFRGKCFFHHSNNEVSEWSLLIRGIRLPLKSRLGYYIEIEKSEKISLTDTDLISLGSKTGSIAHEISNPLAVLRIHCDNFALQAQKTKLLSSDEVLDRMEKLSRATNRISVSNDELKEISQCLVDQNFDRLKSAITNFTDH